jgi:hypothetical protein
MGAMQRNKGQRGERQLADLLREYLGDIVPHEIKRTLDQSREGGCDIHLGCFGIEVKFQEKEFQSRWWGQACTAADKSKLIPVVAYRRSRRGWRFRFPPDAIYGHDRNWQRELDFAVESGVEGFAFVAREALARVYLLKTNGH